MQLSCQVETDAPRKTASLSLSPNLRMEQHHLLEVCWGLVGFNGAVLLQWIASAEWNHAVKWLEQSLHSRCNLVSVVLLHMLFNMWTDFWRKQWFPVEGKKTGLLISAACPHQVQLIAGQSGQRSPRPSATKSCVFCWEPPWQVVQSVDVCFPLVGLLIEWQPH